MYTYMYIHTWIHTHHSVGLRPTCGGPLKALTWPHCTSLEWHSGEDLSLRGLDDLNTQECNSSTSHHVKGRRQREGGRGRERERENGGHEWVCIREMGWGKRKTACWVCTCVYVCSLPIGPLLIFKSDHSPLTQMLLWLSSLGTWLPLAML